jgi:hypothetical protein
MTTINYTSEANLAGGYVKVEWSGLAPDDDGQPFACAGLLIESIHFFGSLGGGQMRAQASNELSPVNFSELVVTSTLGVKIPKVSDDIARSVGSIRPFLNGGVDANAGMAVIFTIPR